MTYRYLKSRSNIKFIPVSVIPLGGQISKYRNYLIADMPSDYVLYGTWTKHCALEFYSSTRYAGLVQYYLVDNRPEINYSIVADDKNTAINTGGQSKVACNKDVASLLQGSIQKMRKDKTTGNDRQRKQAETK